MLFGQIYISCLSLTDNLRLLVDVAQRILQLLAELGEESGLD